MQEGGRGALSERIRLTRAAPSQKARPLRALVSQDLLWSCACPSSASDNHTLASASWLNQVEIWFGIFQRKTLNNASFGSIEQLTMPIHDFTAAYNKNASPFVWRKREVRGAPLRNTIVSLNN